MLQVTLENTALFGHFSHELIDFRCVVVLGTTARVACRRRLWNSHEREEEEILAECWPLRSTAECFDAFGRSALMTELDYIAAAAALFSIFG
jgi:hypothetical protein